MQEIFHHWLFLSSEMWSDTSASPVFQINSKNFICSHLHETDTQTGDPYDHHTQTLRQFNALNVNKLTLLAQTKKPCRVFSWWINAAELWRTLPPFQLEQLVYSLMWKIKISAFELLPCKSRTFDLSEFLNLIFQNHQVYIWNKSC